MRAALAATLAVATLSLAGCATSPTGRSQLMMVSDTHMSQLGITAFNDMRKQGKFVDAPRQRAYATCVANALVAVLVSGVYVAVDQWSSRAAAVAGLVIAVVVVIAVDALGVRTRRATDASAFIFTGSTR